LKAIFIDSIGNLVEWYDFYAYTAFALYFANSFFPGNDPVVQQLNTAVLFAIGFVMRPIGGWLFGHLADHHGRRNALMLSVLLMCFGSLVIAVTPTYASIGAAAPVLLGLARIVQGLSLGGEYGASATYLADVADDKHRGFYVSFHYVTLIGGPLCATPGPARFAAAFPDCGANAGVGLAHPVCHRRHAGRHCAEDAELAA
jgi:MFS transporter, MHS family, alpha-ketoglutarate permease